MQDLANSIFEQATNINKAAAYDAMLPEFKRLQDENESFKKALQKGLSYLADLNGSDWIKSTELGPMEMKARAKGLQSLYWKTLNP